jgi:hypothetical protein
MCRLPGNPARSERVDSVTHGEDIDARGVVGQVATGHERRARAEREKAPRGVRGVFLRSGRGFSE